MPKKLALLAVFCAVPLALALPLSTPAATAATSDYDLPIQGYAGQTSINKGQSIDLHISTKSPSYTLEVYRIGYYGGAGQQLITSASNLPGNHYSVPSPDPTTGLIEANWPTAYTLQTGTDWKSGIYIVKLTAASGDTQYIIFVLRDDSSTSNIVYQVPLATYQAYNDWGGDSLYYNYTTAYSGLYAHKVSFDRPYDSENGLGSLYDGDYQMIYFLESKGYDVSYITSTDLNSHPELLANHKVFLSNYHDEYWSKPMRDNLTAAIGGGMSAAFFSANNIYWQIRYESSTSGSPDRVIVCYKTYTDPITASDPALTTTGWRNTPVNLPENALLGAMYEGSGLNTPDPWVVTNASHWVYAGTGLADGDTIPNLVGGEWDAVVSNGLTPANVTELSNSPITGGSPYPGFTAANGVVYQAPSGAWVFDAGTLRWPLLLGQSGDATYPADSRVQQMTTNILNRMISNPTSPNSSLGVTIQEVSPGNGTAVHPGDTITYQVPYATSGSQDQTNVQIYSTIPANTTLASQDQDGVSSYGANGTTEGNDIWWVNDLLHAGYQSSTVYRVTVAADAPDGAQICAGARIYSDQSGSYASPAATASQVCNTVSNPPSQATAPSGFTAACTLSGSGTSVGKLSWSPVANVDYYKPIIYVPINDACPTYWTDGGTSSANNNRECYGGVSATSSTAVLTAGHSYTGYVYAHTAAGFSSSAAGPINFSCPTPTVSSPNVSSPQASCDSAGTASFSWSGTTDSTGYYDLHVVDAQNTDIFPFSSIGGDPSYTLSHLAPGTYYWSITECDANGCGKTLDSNVFTCAAPVAPTCSLTASPASIAAGGSTKLAWTTTNAETVTLSPNLGTDKSYNDYQYVSPTQNTTYTLSVLGTNGSTVTCTAPVQVTGSTPLGCYWSGNLVPSGTVETAYFESNPNGACVSEQRTCTNGSWSGSYQNAWCTPQPLGCYWSGKLVSSGTVETAYLESNPNGACVSEQRTCTNGSWSGSYQNAWCTPTS